MSSQSCQEGAGGVARSRPSVNGSWSFASGGGVSWRAAREVGVSRTAGNNWARGYKVYRRGRVVGFVPGLERLAVRQISSRYLSQDERIQIADLRHAGLGIRQIAQRLGRAPSTISRELRRNATGGAGYRPFDAHQAATARRARRPGRRVDTNAELGRQVAERLAQRWSPQQISRHLRSRFPERPDMWLCHESIYQALYQPGSVLVRPSPLAPHRRSPLRTERNHRRAHQRTERRRARFEQPMRTVHERPFPPEDRSEAGHWEGDLIIGKDQRSAIGTLVERHDPGASAAAPSAPGQRRLARSADGADGRPAAGAAALDHLGPGHRDGARISSITPVAGRHRSTSATPTRPWQRGSNENTNGLLRDYFPKGTDLSVHTEAHLLAVENELNNRPRMVLHDHTPAHLFTALLASESPSMLRR